MPATSRQTTFCLLLAAFCAAAAMRVRAELAADAAQFIQDRDRLLALRDEIAADRDSMAASLAAGDNGQLRKDVKRFFADRAEAGAIRLAKSADRKQLKIDLNFNGPKAVRPTPGSGVLSIDAASYIDSFDVWTALRQQVENDIELMRSAVAANDTALLTEYATAFFNDSRARLEKRLQWQSDIKAMKKDTAFKGTDKPLPAPGTTLAEHVQEFLNDRAAWEALGTQVEADRNNLRATLSAPESLESSVRIFLADRRARHVKGVELYLDRKAMRKDVGLSSGSRDETKPGGAASSRDGDKDEEDEALEATAESAGEK